MDNPVFSWERFYQTPIVAILRGLNTTEVLRLAGSYLKCGFTTIEVTMNSPQVPETVQSLLKEFPELNVGVGTVCSMDDLNIAISSGSQFIVTPIINEEVIIHCKQNNIPIFPGAYTPTEIYKAWVLGASAVKVFPATLGPKYIKDVLAPLDQIKLLPTGGVNKENIKDFFKAGAIGAGMGGHLFPKELIERDDLTALENHLMEFKEIVDKIKEH
ncbi:bifunctional 4-hydroxy-2-oxoglutarate aldolase/2-dehydro-3-deoxy-phosphogluconate aldolase [Cytophaga sp. FL35]|uniref:bifunctional 4-hydroxy-2-oxoglutarate aldolase/2-dehydro-3-deoxy-phosphogluconate aldolase n=1 Tax=Cytophaga sp. FL35 TaxID=1904456 RepID=UPI00165366D7|nr:bifunctional 4-hydroxy-2-oxoglutarate aldolase/2-dehydro-3-deoxy-phosphogluconate aldolase [Cytophaga sp. FL35]MBC6999116.1 bifunctional 4-hydroxy-2-oxoglutarate aldolase/2-dehydro-3-deoxy-phosphogluconate aldolase [Cytophaga sp. FL35]